jgi:hypothetical protein
MSVPAAAAAQQQQETENKEESSRGRPNDHGQVGASGLLFGAPGEANLKEKEICK